MKNEDIRRYICTISDKELLEKCQECVRVIRAAKETQAARANQNATILLEELDAERCREESRRQAAARRRERKKKKKLEKKVPHSYHPLFGCRHHVLHSPILMLSSTSYVILFQKKIQIKALQSELHN